MDKLIHTPEGILRPDTEYYPGRRIRYINRKDVVGTIVENPTDRHWRSNWVNVLWDEEYQFGRRGPMSVGKDSLRFLD